METGKTGEVIANRFRVIVWHDKNIKLWQWLYNPVNILKNGFYNLIG